MPETIFTCGIRPGAPGLIAKVCFRVGFHLPLLLRRCKSLRRRRNFPRRWSAAGVVGSALDSGPGTLFGEPSVFSMD